MRACGNKHGKWMRGCGTITDRDHNNGQRPTLRDYFLFHLSCSCIQTNESCWDAWLYQTLGFIKFSIYKYKIKVSSKYLHLHIALVIRNSFWIPSSHAPAQMKCLETIIKHFINSDFFWWWPCTSFIHACQILCWNTFVLLCAKTQDLTKMRFKNIFPEH